MTAKHPPPAEGVPTADESPTARLDRLLHATAAPLTGGLSPVSLALAWADWAWHLGVSPGRQMELAALGARLAAFRGRFDEAQREKGVQMLQALAAHSSSCANQLASADSVRRR